MVANSILLEDLQRVGRDLGRSPTYSLYEKLGKFGSTTIKNHFGGWNPALKEAGFNINFERYIPSAIKVLSKEEAAYIAGIVDGEGHIGIHRARNYLGVCCSIANTHLPVLEWIKQISGGGRVMVHKESRRNCKKSYLLNFRKREIEDLLPQLLPYLIVKKQDAEKVILHCKGGVQ